jgi:hypothetical protein
MPAPKRHHGSRGDSCTLDVQMFDHGLKRPERQCLVLFDLFKNMYCGAYQPMLHVAAGPRRGWPRRGPSLAHLICIAVYVLDIFRHDIRYFFLHAAP